MIYYVLYFFLFILALFEKIDSEQEVSGIVVKKTIYFYTAAIITLFIGLRHGIGLDFYSYKSIYNSYPNIQLEYGFNFIMYITKEILKLPYNYFLLTVTIISLSIKTIFFRKYFDYPTMFLFFNFPQMINTDFGLIRQGLALSVCLWTLPAIKERNFIKFIIIWVIAVSFHNSAIILFPLFFLNKITITPIIFFIVFFFGFLFNAVQGSVIIFSSLASLLSDTFIGKVMNYILFSYGITSNPLFYLIKPSSIICIVIMIIYWQKIYKKDFKEKEFEYTAFNIYFILFLIIRIFDSIAMLAVRGGYFLEILEIFLFYYIINSCKHKESKLLMYLFVILYGIFQITSTLNHFAFDLTGNEFGRYQVFSEFFGL